MTSTRNKRIGLIKSIEEKRGSLLISYITSDRHGLTANIAGDVVNIINNHLLAGNISKDSNIDLFLYSRGGNSDVPWNLVSKIREYIPDGRFGVVVPYRCHSAATVIALGADEIIMSAQAELGPIDATIISGPHNPIDEVTKSKRPISVEDVTGYFNLLKRVYQKEEGKNLSEDSILKTYDNLSKQIDPLVLGSVDRLLEQTKLVASKLILSRKEEIKEKDVKTIVSKLSSEIFSHNHAISRTEALEDIGISWIKKTKDLDIKEEVWALYKEYEEYFKFDKIFNPEQQLMAADVDEMKFSNLNVACVESEARLDVCRRTFKVKRLKAVPNQVNLNLGSIGLPAITLPEIEGINAEQVQQIVQHYLNTIVPNIIKNTAKEVKDQFIKALPEQGFQRTDLDSGWKKIR